jgi:hypothetical protein
MPLSIPNYFPGTFVTSLFLFFASIIYAGDGHVKDTAECLEITGSVSADGDSTDHIIVELVLDNEQVELLDVASFQPFKFYLKKNKSYTIKLSKNRFIQKSITVNTDLPPGTKIKSLLKFHFETDLVKAPDDQFQRKSDALDFPIALVRYDVTKKKFDYSQKYNDMVNDLIDQDLRKIYGGDGEVPPKPKKDKKK